MGGQEVIAETCVGGFRGDGYKFQAAGREDIDVGAPPTRASLESFCFCLLGTAVRMV